MNVSRLTDLFSLDGKVAVVTGGSRGLGKAMVQGFAEAGADVVIASRKLDACEVLAKEIEASTGQRALPVQCHVGIWQDCDRLVETVYERFGRCDVLVNNAGMSPLYPDLESISEELYDKVLDVNLKGPFRLGALFGTRMAGSGGGSIINVSSVGSLRPSATALAYCCAKSGLNALTVGLADAFGPSVRVNCVLAGPFDTDVAKYWTEERRQLSADAAALKRLGEPEDIIGTALWLATDASGYVTGAQIRVDGGACRQTS